jgi:hypothetical protein
MNKEESNAYKAENYSSEIATVSVPFKKMNINVYMLQAFAEIRHFRKCLGNSGNDWVFLNCLGNCRNIIYFTTFKIWEMAKHTKKLNFKTILG